MSNKIEVTKNGPYMVSGGIPLQDEKIIVDSEGTPCKWKKGKSYHTEGPYLLCRCGQSKWASEHYQHPSIPPHHKY